MHGKGVIKAFENYRERIFDLFLDNGKFWIIINFINLYLFHILIEFISYNSIHWYGIYIYLIFNIPKNETNIKYSID